MILNKPINIIIFILFVIFFMNGCSSFTNENNHYDIFEKVLLNEEKLESYYFNSSFEKTTIKKYDDEILITSKGTIKGFTNRLYDEMFYIYEEEYSGFEYYNREYYIENLKHEIYIFNNSLISKNKTSFEVYENYNNKEPFILLLKTATVKEIIKKDNFLLLILEPNKEEFFESPLFNFYEKRNLDLYSNMVKDYYLNVIVDFETLMLKEILIGLEIENEEIYIKFNDNKILFDYNENPRINLDFYY
jgi:hypothetical protein